MTKSELINILSKKHPNLYVKDVETIVNTVFNEIADGVASDRRVEIRGFGAFSLRERSSRNARNPRTGEKVVLGDRYSLYFRAGKLLKQKLNA